MEEQIKYCPACGSPQDEDGICTKTTCMRRKLQLKLKKITDEAKKEQGGTATDTPNGTTSG